MATASTPATPNGIQRYASVIRLRPEHEAEYRRLHADVWPGVLRRIRDSGITNYSIFLRDGMLFSYYEYVGDNHDRDLAAMADDPETRRWWELTDPCQQPVDSAAPGERWAALTEVFHTP
jgi:L-rhamnose mutarotase